MQFNSTIDNALSSAKIEMFVNGEKCVLNDYDPINDVMTGQTFNLGDVLTIKPLSGYVLDPNDGMNAISDYLTNSTWNFEISPDRKLGTLTITGAILDGYLDYKFNSLTAPIDVPDNDPNPIDNIKRGVNNIYLLDREKARQVMSKAFFIATEGANNPDGISTQFFDMSEYIINLINVPFPIDPKYIIGDTNVKIISYDTGIIGTEINTDTLIIDMGFIDVPKINNDLTDFDNVKAVLHLPYGNEITLNPPDIIGYKINIEYWLNVYNGKAVINVYSSKTGEIIQSQKVDLGVNVPFNKTSGTVPKNNSFNQIDDVGYNGLNYAYVEIKQYDILLKDGVFTAPILDESILTDVKGFIDVENIDLKVNATLNEKSDILNLLKNGVIIK